MTEPFAPWLPTMAAIVVGILWVTVNVAGLIWSVDPVTQGGVQAAAILVLGAIFGRLVKGS